MHFRIENSKAISWVMACLLVGLMGGGEGVFVRRRVRKIWA